MSLHKDISAYVKYMRSRLYWYSDSDPRKYRIVGICTKYYFYSRPFIFFVMMIGNIVGLYLLEGMGMLDGSLLFLPVAVSMVVLNAASCSSQASHERLVMSYNKFFNNRNEPWMVTLRLKYTKPLWKFVNFIKMYNQCISGLYLFLPITLDVVFHIIFDVLDKPFIFPMTFTPFLGKNFTWNTKYYAISVINIWNGWEMVMTLQGFIIGYAMVTVYYLTELLIFKKMIQSLNFEEGYIKSRQELKTIVVHHNEMITLNKDLKAFLGLPCAFQTLFTSLTLTLTLFTTFTSSNIPVVLAYGSGFVFYFSAGLLYCSLGQLLQTESEEVFRALYNLPWYRYSPAIRKDLNMMMRQARTPLIIDYHGRSKMNLSNFMQILRSAYSYFTLLQSMTSKS